MPHDRDPDEDIFDEGQFHDDGTDDLLDKLMADMEDGGEDDSGGLDQPHIEPDVSELDTISPESGRDIIEEAEISGAKRPKKAVSDNPAADGGEETDEPQEPPSQTSKENNDDASQGQEAEADNIAAAANDDILARVPDDIRSEVAKRISAAEDVLAPFKSFETELSQHGKTPADAIKRMVELNNFARSSPDEYIAWVSEQSGEKPHEALEKAAALMGFTLAKADDDDGLFEDPETKALREENERLKAQVHGSAPKFGPDTPERQQIRQAEQALTNFIQERGKDGVPLRPHFDHLRPRITEMANHHQKTTGQAVTLDNLQAFYDAAAQEAQRAFSPQNNIAATSQASVQDQIKDKAVAAAKARRASKTIDGTGQGASRRPAIPKGASIDTVIDTLWDDLEKSRGHPD